MPPIFPSKREQKEIIDALIVQQNDDNNNKQEGQEWYVLPGFWFVDWKLFVSQRSFPARSGNGFFLIFLRFSNN